MIKRNNFLLGKKYTLFITVASYFLIIVPQFVIADTPVPVPVKQIKYLFSITGDKTSPLSLPSDVAVDQNGNIYIVDSGNHRIAVFDDAGEYISTISKKGQKQGELTNPVGIDVNENNIYIADKDNHRIQIFDIDGKYKKSITLRQDGKLIRPIDIAVNKDLKLLYISGNNNHKLMAYDYSGKLLHQWGGEGTNRGEFRYPATISLFNNNVYVVDVLNSRVQIFNAKGELEAIVGEWGVLPGQLFRPKGVALDKKGNIYVSDSYLGLIQVFSSDTRFSHVLGNNEKPYKLTSPAGITIDKNNRLYVCEMLKNKVSVFSLEP